MADSPRDSEGRSAGTRVELPPAADRVRRRALTYPEAWEDHPWGDIAIKVRKKAFVFMGVSGDGTFGVSVKLPQSKEFALEYPWTSRTGYGLGQHGWISARFGPDEDLPMDLLEGWIRESYTAIAPKTLVKQLEPES